MKNQNRSIGRRIVNFLAIGSIVAIPLLGVAPSANALPGQCGGGYAGGNGGEFCDTEPWADGSFMHTERVCVLGFCGTNRFRACHVPGGRVATDNDPNTPC